MNNVNVAGNGSSSDGRPVITVQIATSGTGSWSVDDSGNAQSNTNYHIWNAVQGCEGCVPPDGAIGMWNKAPDTGQPGESQAPYFFKLDQNAQKPTIKIVRDPNVSTCARTIGPNGGPYELHIPPNATNRDLWSLLGTIAHEFAHPMGLDDNYDNNCYSIMSQAAAGCVYDGADVTQGDVNAAWQVLASKASCSGTVHQTSYDQCDGQVANDCIDSGGNWDEEACTCYNPPGCDQSWASDCYSNGGSWDTGSCTCTYAEYYYDYNYYQSGYYECYDYYRVTDYYQYSGEGNTWTYLYSTTEYTGSECYLIMT